MNENNDILRELDEIIKLAEESTIKIDELSYTIEKLKNYMYLSSSSLYLIVCIIVVGSIKITVMQESGLFNNNILPALFIVFFVLIFFIISIYFIYSKIMQIKSMKRTFAIEKNIHDKLVLMVDEQLSRVKIRTNLSPVTQATLEIRIRRLDRTNTKIT